LARASSQMERARLRLGPDPIPVARHFELPCRLAPDDALPKL
jgi:hypothetical protein